MQNHCLRRPYNRGEKRRNKRQRRKAKIYPLECRLPKIVRREKKAFLSDQCKETEETIEWERLETSSRKFEITREHFIQRWAL